MERTLTGRKKPARRLSATLAAKACERPQRAVAVPAPQSPAQAWLLLKTLRRTAALSRTQLGLLGKTLPQLGLLGSAACLTRRMQRCSATFRAPHGVCRDSRASIAGAGSVCC